MTQQEQILKKYWGYSGFRPLQDEIISSVLEGNDVLGLMPTGGGKSICFQVPGLINEGICIVISPLIALIKDQVSQLTRRGINATAIYSGLKSREIDILLDNCIYGNIKFLYVSPERLKSELFIERVKKMKVGLLVIDEAHCISQWGYDFRPPYLEIAEFRKLLPDTNMIAVTATATPKVELDITEKLEMKNPGIFRMSFSRSNLSYAVRKVENKETKLLEIAKRLQGSGIIYTGTRKSTRELSDMLNRHGLSADYYHAGLGQDVRSVKQDLWIKNRVKIIVSTNAFGMGIDKPDVRYVIHYDIPSSPEAYYQEAGRAGRDGNKSFAVILYDDEDIAGLLKKVNQSNPSLKQIKTVYQALANHFKIAIGSSGGESYDFDINTFSEIYKMDKVLVYHCLKKLEKYGLIHLNEAFHNPSKVWILLQHDELYKFQVANSRLDPFIKAILRMYGGEIFSQFVTISEKNIAAFMKVPVKAVIEGLELLHKFQVIDYDKQKEKPQLLFIKERLDSDHIPISVKELDERRKVEEEKVRSMVLYATKVQGCRSKILLEYFGESEAEDCGMCDLCIDSKKEHTREKEKEIEEKLLGLLKEKPYDIEELSELFDISDKNLLMYVVKNCIDNHRIQYNGEWKIQLLKDK